MNRFRQHKLVLLISLLMIAAFAGAAVHFFVHAHEEDSYESHSACAVCHFLHVLGTVVLLAAFSLMVKKSVIAFASRNLVPLSLVLSRVLPVRAPPVFS